MSTKLYTGIKFKSNKLSTVIRQLNSLKEEAKKNVNDTFRKGSKSLNFVHLIFLYEKALEEGMKPLKKNPGVFDMWDFERKLHNELRKPYNDFSVEFGVTIFERKNKLYGVYYDQTHENYQMLFDRDIAVDYHYQNQVDKPDDVSNRDWYFRETVWEDIFEDISCCWVPSEAGAVYKIVDVDDICITKEVVNDLLDAIEELKKKEEAENVL